MRPAPMRTGRQQQKRDRRKIQSVTQLPRAIVTLF